MRRLVLFVVTVCLAASASAWGYWSGTSVAGGSGATAATTVNAGSTPTAGASGQSVTVTWPATTTANAQPVTGYLVQRYDASTGAVQTVLTSCAGTITATSCTEAGVPTGSWRYSVTPRIGSSWLGAESSRSVAVDVGDVTAPTNNISLTLSSGDASLTGTTIYYRGVASGQVRLSNAVSDAGSGPASSQTGALSGTTTGWSHTGSTVSTPSTGPYVSDPFSWTAGTTTSPQVTVTGRDVSGNGAATTLSFTNDSTAPVGSTISYADGVSTGRSVSITLVAGTDAGSGIGVRRLQRASAPLSGNACGTWTAFSNLEPTAPTSPYSDTNISAGACYKYQYVVNDKLGNQAVATSANVVKVDYAATVSATPGLVSLWRFGESPVAMTAYDSMTGADLALLTGRSGEVGASWTLRTGTSARISQNRAYRDGAGSALYQASAVPGNADYSVEADLSVRTNLTGDMLGVVGRLDPAATTYYMARWEAVDSSWNIVKVVNGAAPTYPAYVASQGPLTPGATYRVRLEMAGTSLKLFVNGVLTASATDSTAPITAAGRGGFLDGNAVSTAAAVTKTSTSGLHLDNFQVLPATYPRAADSKGSNTGDYKHGPTLGVSGALAGDANTAAQFDGVNDYVQVSGSSGIPVGSALRSVEAWFKTSATTKGVLFDYGSLAATQRYGLWIDAGGTTMTAWGWGNGNDKVFTMPQAVTDGVWHHVVQTFNGTSAMTLYIDGVALPSQAVTRDTVMDAYGLGIGAVINPADSTNSGLFFNGAIDEVALYSTVLSAATVTDHYQLGKAVADTSGPAGGSVDAAGLVGTGARYSTSATLSLTFATGTDPSGLGASGFELRRATAPLTNGTCGTYGSSTLVATDPTSPRSDGVGDQACYRYEYIVADVYGNPTKYTSGDIKVDTTAPAAPTLAFSAYSASTNAYASASTVYYRSAATSGSFAVTPTSTDAGSGVSTYVVPSLGTGWTMTPSGGAATYSWSGAPAAPGSKNFSARNNAGLTSAGTAVAFLADDTAPSAGTVTYPDTTQTATSVSVGFTTGTDGGSGVDTRLLQRTTATLTGTTCGTFNATYTTIAGGTSPNASPVVDPVTAGSCYKYQYVVTDKVGNQHVATSANVVKVVTAATGSPSTNLALNKPVTVTSTESASFPGGNAVDGNAGTRWSSASADPQSITVDLGSLQNIARVRLQWEAAYATAYTIQTSTDGTTFTNARSITGGDGGIDDTIGLGAMGRYVRILGTTRATAYGYSLWELEVYGSVSYADSVSATAGLVNYYRLGEATTSADTFTGTAGALLQNRTGETGATWTKHPASNSDVAITNAGRVRKDAATSARALYYTSAVPSSADYTVEADVYVASNLATNDDIAGVVGRLDSANTGGTYYVARYEQANQKWNLYRVVNGVFTYLGQSAAVQPLTVGATYRLGLAMAGSTIRVLVNGVQQVSVVDTGITAAGRGGIMMGFHASASTTVTDTTGLHLDNFTITPPMADSRGTNHGDYLYGPTLGVAGALTNDTSSAVQFDGFNDYATFTRQVSDDFSIEFWFKSTQGIGTGPQWFNGAGLVDGDVSGVTNDFGVSLRSDGRIVAGVGNADTSIVSTNASYNNNAWHHVVFTRTKLNGALALYVDGVAAGTATGNTVSLVGPTTLNIGRILSGGNYLAGTIDEVAVYSTALGSTTVSDHYAAR